jgi:UDP-N-acetylmuramoyl-tripeptide--D-alanyl-D-alanine ligase
MHVQHGLHRFACSPWRRYVLALRGETFDGHSFVAEAAKRGATGAIVEDAPADLPPDFAIVRVPNTLVALQQLASHYRRSLPVQIVCITGSNGKTSTKDFTWSVLRERFQVTKTEGNLNNHIGLPMTMLRLRGGDRMAVLEIGMNHPGEIAPLAALAQPDTAIITNIGVAHIEHLGSREAIAQEKGALAEVLPPSGTVILNADDDFTPFIAKRTKADALLCGLGQNAAIRATDLRQELSGMKFRINAFGRSVEAHPAGARHPHGSQCSARRRYRPHFRHDSRGMRSWSHRCQANQRPTGAESRPRDPGPGRQLQRESRFHEGSFIDSIPNEH